MSDDRILRHLVATLPHVFGPLPEGRVERLASLFHQVALARGEVLYRRGEPGDCMHTVLSGRLQIRMPDDGDGRRVLGAAMRGDCVGEVSLLTDLRRTSEVVAVRDTILARLDRQAFQEFTRECPEAGYNLALFAVRRVYDEGTDRAPPPQVHNIALVSLDPDLPLGEFGRRLELALLRFGSTAYLDRRTVLRRLKENEGDDDARLDPTRLELMHLLDRIEGRRRYVVYEADPEPSDWTRVCLHQADRVLLVARAASSRSLRPIERQLPRGPHNEERTGTDLVLLHPDSASPPADTASWLAPRDVDRHHHVVLDGARGVHRLARLLTGNAVTLVLGGGGARGFAHIGAVRALREAGVPIDAVGGTSIGSIIGGVVAQEWEDERILQSSRRAFCDERPLNDYTWPVFALLRGEKLSRVLFRTIGDDNIEDLWLPFFCVSSNLSRGRATVHRSGKLWKAMRASASLPAILPPLVHDGELLVDGGVLNNLPVDVMRRLVPGIVVAIDLGGGSEEMVAGNSTPSTLEYLKNRVQPGRKGRGFPTISSIVIRAMTLGRATGASAEWSGSDLLLQPDLEDYGLLDWDRIFDIADAGYEHTKERLPAWIEANPHVVQRDEGVVSRSNRGDVS